MVLKVEVKSFDDQFVKDTLADWVSLLQKGYQAASRQGLDYDLFNNVTVHGVSVRHLGLVVLASRFEASVQMYSDDSKLKSETLKSLKAFLGDNYDVSSQGGKLLIRYNKLSAQDDWHKVAAFLEKCKGDFRQWRQEVKRKYLDPIKKDEAEFYLRKDKLDQLSSLFTSEIDKLKT